MKLTNYLVNLVTATHIHMEMDIQDTSTTTHSNHITGQDIRMLSNRKRDQKVGSINQKLDVVPTAVPPACVCLI